MDQWTLVQLKGGDVAADRSSHGPTNFRILNPDSVFATKRGSVSPQQVGFSGKTGNSRGPTSEVFVPSKDLLKKQTDSRSYAKVLQSRKSSSDSNGFNAALTGQRSTVLSQSRVVPQVLDRFDGRITGGNDVTRPAMKQVAKPAIPKSGENAVVFGRSSRRSNLNAVSFNRKSPSDKALGGSSCAGRATLCGGGQLAESIKRDVTLSLDLCNSVTRRRSHSPVSEIEVDDAERLLVVPVPFPDLIHCPKCHFKSYKGATNVESMLRHLLRDHGIEGVQAKFLCRWCNFSPAERYKYPLKVVRAHVVQEHPSMKLEEADLPLPHSCPNCRVSYPTYQGLSNHTRKCKSMKGLCETPKTSKPQGSTQNRANNVVGKPVQQIEVPRTTEKAIELMVIDLSDSDSEPRVANKAELRKAELARLRCLTLFNGEGAWLSCGVIREYLDMRLPKHLCVDAAVFQRPQILERSHIWGNIMTNLDSTQSVFMPININADHWVLASFRMADTIIRYYDSLGGPAPSNVVERLLVIAKLLKSPAQSVYVVPNHLFCSQSDNYNCGAYVCMLSERLAHGSHALMTKDDADNWRRVALQAMRNSKKPKTPTKPLGYTPPAGALCTVVDHIHAAEQWYAQQPRMELAVDVQPLVDIGQTLVDQSLVERMDISNDVETLSLRKEITLNLDGLKRKLKRKQPSATPNAVPKVVKGPKKPKPFIETPIKSGQPLEEARNIKAHKAPEVTFAKFLFEGPAALQCWSEVEEALESLPFMINATKRNEDPLDQSKWKQVVVPPSEEGSGVATQTVSSRGHHKRVLRTNGLDLSQKDWVRLYHEDRAKCMDLILPECSVKCTVSRNACTKFFTEQFSAPSEPSFCALLRECANVLPTISTHQSEGLLAPVTSGEVLDALKRADTAPGPDKLTYRDLKEFDPSGSVLAGLLSQCLSHQRIPMCWKNARTVLLYKKGDRLELSNWRPITLSNVIYKVFTSILAKRVTAFKTLISPEQKGFTDFDGCGDHTAVLSTMIERTASTKNNIAVAWLDLKNAFGSVPHNVILETLAAMGFGAKFTNVVEDLYTNTTTSIVTAAGTTLPILIKSGVKQGDPISPILFNLCMEVLLRSLKWKDDVKLLAFADDLALAASTTDCLQSALDKLVSNASRMGLTFNPTKCASLVVQKGKMCLDTAIKIGGSPVRLLDDEGVYTYLGINIGVHSRLSLEGPLKKGLDDTEKIVASNIAPWQKLDAIKTFILPRFSFFIRNGDPYLKDLDAFDKQMVRHVKSLLNIPNFGASRHYLHGSPRLGGIGIRSLTDEYHIGSVAGISRLLFSTDRSVSDFMNQEFTRLVARWVKKPMASVKNRMDFPNCAPSLCGKLVGSEAHSIWTRMRRSARHLKKFLGTFEFVLTDNQTLGIKAGRAERLIDLSRRDAASQLRQIVANRHIDIMVSDYKSQGKVLAVTAQSEMSNQFLRNGRFVSFSAYRWIHRARLNLHLLNGTNKRAADQRCRICGQRETLPHVLNHCKRAMTLITRRHNAVQNRLVNAIPRRSEQMVYVNRRIPGICSARRPDIVVIKPDSKEAVIIDVTIPFENGARALVDAAQRKIEKYEPEIGELQAIGYKVKAFAFVIGSLGTWCPLNTRVLKELRVNRVYGRKMATLMLAETVEFSKDIFWSHILADRYKIPKGRFFKTMPEVSKDLKSKSPTTAEPLSLQEEDADDTPSARSPRPAPRRKRPPAPTPMTLKLQRPAPKKKIAGTEEEDHKRKHLLDRIVKTPPPKRRRPTTQ